MLDAGAQINARTINREKTRDFTALHAAVQNTNVSTVKLLLDRGADPKLEGKFGKKFAHELEMSGTALDWAKTKLSYFEEKEGTSVMMKLYVNKAK